MIYNLRTQRGRSMTQFVEEKLTERAVAPEMWPREETAADLPALKARIDYGRWLVDCPFCPNANLVDLEDLRSFCCLCFNAKAGYRWLAVQVPADREDIEQALDDGREEHALAWQDGMTLQDVQAGAPVATVPISPEQLLQTAQLAWDARDELLARIAALQEDVALRDEALQAERSGTLLLLRHHQRLSQYLEQEREFNRVLAASQQWPHPHEHN